MKKLISRAVIIFACLINLQDIDGQWLDLQNLQSTVLLEKIENNSFITHGTGILMYNYDRPYEFIVITCAHIIKGKEQISVRVRPDSTFLNLLAKTGQKQIVINNAIVIENTVRFIANLGAKDKYIHPELDIAAFRLQIPPVIYETDTSQIMIDMTKLLGIPKSGVDYKKDLSLNTPLL